MKFFMQNHVAYEYNYLTTVYEPTVQVCEPVTFLQNYTLTPRKKMKKNGVVLTNRRKPL